MTFAALALALVNVGLMRVIWTKAFGLQEATYKRLSLLHRAFGYSAFGIMIFIAVVTCIGIIGYGSYDKRPTWHSWLGISVLALMVIKIVAVRKGLPESPVFRKRAMWTAAIGVIALAIVAATSTEKATAFVLPLFPAVLLLGFYGWRRFGYLPVVGTGLLLTIALLFASSGGWWFADRLNAGDRADVSSALEIEGDAELGASVFAANCASCHGRDGRGGFGPSLRSGTFNYRFTDERIAQQVRQGGGRMPGFDASRITDQDLAGLIAFIRNWYAN
jgi:mono/diheme cytochrome c family protein